MTEQEVGKPLLPNPYALALTGQRATDTRRCQFHVVLFCGTPVRLTNGPFTLLLELARARITTHSGYYSLTPQEDPDALRLGVHRLRRQIDARLGVGAGIQWIQTGVASEYRLISPSDDIAVDGGFAELPRTLVPTDLRDFIVKRCRVVKVEDPQATSVQSK